MQWMELKIQLTERMKEGVTNRLFELGADSIREEEAAGKTTLVAAFEPTKVMVVGDELTKYFDALASLFPAEPKITFEWNEVSSENWSERYREFYKAQKLTHIFFLKPAWDEITQVPPEMIGIEMDPGQAFGTGLHATTRLSMRMIEMAVRLYPYPDRLHLLDVGTGTGILSIAAFKLGVESVVSVDNDPVAVVAARENVARNECAQIQVSGNDIVKIDSKFDIIVANILLETHVELKAHYKRLLKKGGQLILSGILASQKRELDGMMKQMGLVEEFSEYQQEWAGVAYYYDWNEKA